MRDPNIEQKVIKIAQELIADDRASVSSASIYEAIDRTLLLHAAWKDQIDREVVAAELIRRFSLWIGQSATLKSDEGHLPWLNAQRKADWRYWQRYREFLEKKNSERSVEALDKVTDEILGLLEDPAVETGWDRRGLVVGHVQSGKTSNYTGLICKAADAGYKIIVVLAGVHNNLRSQTQMRLDEGFLGYETSPDPEALRIIGVGEIDGDPKIRPNFLTNRSNKGDFNTSLANKLGITPEQRPWLFVVKKNKTVLERLNRWIRTHVANLEDPVTGQRQVTNLPLLVIDDEADHASVDTGADVVDENGVPDEEHQPKVINSLIRRLLAGFSRSAYVGYTATPFANIFIHEKGRTREEGPDLFPSAFIINLAAPSTYIGPARVFGTPSENGRDGALPVVREIKDSASKDGLSGWMPAAHKNGHYPRVGGEGKLPESLRTAVDAFLLSCTLRMLRGQGDDHASMLIHVTRFTSVQGHVHDQVEEYLRHVRQRILRGIDDKEVMARLRTLFETDFLPTTASIRASEPEMEVPPDVGWDEVAEALPSAIADIELRRINGTAKDALDYADTKGPGLKVIAIGGDKLSRGLTLEGLCVSYFLRSSKMYDTLMQMGRWFGYRPGYADLCRLWCTAELKEWFEHIADASEELREEFDAMSESGGTPRDFGLKVQSHPTLMVTSPLKMRSSRTLMLSFNGQLVETVSLPTDTKVLQDNYSAALRLVENLGDPDHAPDFSRNREGVPTQWNAAVWNSASGDAVVEFLRSYRTSPKALKVRSPMLADFIETMMRQGELREWTVAIPGSGRAAQASGLIPGIGMIKRVTTDKDDDRSYRIGRLLSPRDEAIDLDDAAWTKALEITRAAWHADPARQKRQREVPSEPNGPGIRKARQLLAGSDHPPKGLLLVYLIDPAEAGHGSLSVDTAEAIIGIALSFPVSSAAATVPYEVTNLFWEQEYGAAE